MSPYNAKSEKMSKSIRKDCGRTRDLPDWERGEGHPGVAALAICPVGRGGRDRALSKALASTRGRGIDPPWTGSFLLLDCRCPAHPGHPGVNRACPVGVVHPRHAGHPGMTHACPVGVVHPPAPGDEPPGRASAQRAPLLWFAGLRLTPEPPAPTSLARGAG